MSLWFLEFSSGLGMTIDDMDDTKIIDELTSARACPCDLTVGQAVRVKGELLSVTYSSATPPEADAQAPEG